MKAEIREGKREPTFAPGRDPWEGAPGDCDGPSPDAIEFLRGLLMRDTCERPTAEEALRMDFLRHRGSHAEALPSLHPMLTRACCWGAFENVDASLVKVRPQAASPKSARGDTSARARMSSSQQDREERGLSLVAESLSTPARSHDQDDQQQLPTLLTISWAEALKHAIGDERAPASPWSLKEPISDMARI